jgi:hypothetical protein
VEVRASSTANGTSSAPAGIINPGFLFEPEAPLNPLEPVPIFSELENLLDDRSNIAETLEPGDM